jgi:hypothetical protein
MAYDSGKSYSIGVIAEELCNLPKEQSKNIAPLIFDTMGIFWTMRYKNEKDAPLLKKWELKPKELPINIFIPEGKSKEYKQNKIPFDKTFSLKPSELEAEDWMDIFNISLISNEGVLIQKAITELKEKNKPYTINQITEKIQTQTASEQTKEIASSLFTSAESWGIFSKTSEGTEISDLVTAGETTVLDISVYSSISAFNIRALVISLVSRKLFQERMTARKKEEIDSIRHGLDYLSYSQEKEVPLIWLFVLATQQPGQIHTDVMTQSDIVISHRVTSQPDIQALNLIMQSYLLENIKKSLDDLPRLKGSAIILDDNSERLYPIQIRPKFTWHGGEAPTAVKPEKLF